MQAIMDEALKANGNMPYYCNTHGKLFFLPGIRPECPTCGAVCFTPDEWEYRDSVRLRRSRRIQLIRNHLE